MASIIPFHPSVAVAAARAADRQRPLPAGLPRGFLPRLAAAITGAARRELARRELSRLDDRLLRDIGLCRDDLATPAGRSLHAARPAAAAAFLSRPPGA
jgi:uncharacterized protein YjiS (DUF1127 family)